MVKKKIASEEVPVEKKRTPGSYIHAVGRRRESVARVRLHTDVKDLAWGEKSIKAGDIIVNEKPIEQYFFGEASKVQYMEPLRTTNTIGKYAITIRVVGGGPAGQLQAAVHGMARALEKLDKEAHRGILKKKGLLTRDARTRERRKVGTGGKARRAKQSPKR